MQESPFFSIQSGHDGLATAPRGVVHGHVLTAVQLLSSRIAEPWTLSALADEVHLSRSQLVRAFDATVGVSPMAHLLISTDLSISEAARSVGWRNQFHASQCFHAAYGVSPTEYRRQHATSPQSGYVVSRYAVRWRAGGGKPW